MRWRLSRQSWQRSLGASVTNSELPESSRRCCSGAALAAWATELVALGASTVFIVDHPLLADADADASVTALRQVCDQVNPDVLLFGHTSFGRDVAPRLAIQLQTAAVPDCLDVQGDPETQGVKMIRPVYGGNALGTFVIAAGRPQIATLRSKIHEPSAPDPSRTGRIVKLVVNIRPEAVRVKRVQSVKDDSAGPRLEDASVVVGGGRGMGSADGFRALDELAMVLGAALGGSRAAVDAGWIASGQQIGQTGKTISPEVYIAVGVSGAMQHMAGAQSSKVIVAINRDADAPIFKMALYGVVGDWRRVLPLFSKRSRHSRYGTLDWQGDARWKQTRI